ncbi:hypothetical protein LTR60_002696, partial [Cryomyces antarcticus]
ITRYWTMRRAARKAEAAKTAAEIGKEDEEWDLVEDCEERASLVGIGVTGGE